MSEKVVDVKNLHVAYYGHEVLSNISFNVSLGKRVGIIGPNGAGKSTMIKAILGLIPSSHGTIKVLGQNIDKVRKQVAYIPQRNNVDWDFPINVFDTVVLGTYPKLGLFKRPGQKEKELAKVCLKRVGMETYAHKQIGELSGGQQQRVFMARALAQEADIYFLDEPFVGIDIASEKIILSLLDDLRKAGKTVFVVHHDLSKVHEYFDELILINKELIQAGSVDDVFTEAALKEAYGTTTMLGGLNYGSY